MNVKKLVVLTSMLVLGASMSACGVSSSSSGETSSPEKSDIVVLNPNPKMLEDTNNLYNFELGIESKVIDEDDTMIIEAYYKDVYGEDFTFTRKSLTFLVDDVKGKNLNVVIAVPTYLTRYFFLDLLEMQIASKNNKEEKFLVFYQGGDRYYNEKKIFYITDGKIYEIGDFEGDINDLAGNTDIKNLVENLANIVNRINIVLWGHGENDDLKLVDFGYTMKKVAYKTLLPNMITKEFTTFKNVLEFLKEISQVKGIGSIVVDTCLGSSYSFLKGLMDYDVKFDEVVTSITYQQGVGYNYVYGLEDVDKLVNKTLEFDNIMKEREAVDFLQEFGVYSKEGIRNLINYLNIEANAIKLKEIGKFLYLYRLAVYKVPSNNLDDLAKEMENTAKFINGEEYNVDIPLVDIYPVEGVTKESIKVAIENNFMPYLAETLGFSNETELLNKLYNKTGYLLNASLDADSLNKVEAEEFDNEISLVSIYRFLKDVEEKGYKEELRNYAKSLKEELMNLANYTLSGVKIYKSERKGEDLSFIKVDFLYPHIESYKSIEENVDYANIRSNVNIKLERAFVLSNALNLYDVSKLLLEPVYNENSALTQVLKEEYGK